MIEIDSAMADAIRRGDTGAFTAAAMAQPQYSSLTRSAITLAAAGGTTLAEAIATTSGLDTHGSVQKPATTLVAEELTDALLTGQVA